VNVAPFIRHIEETCKSEGMTLVLSPTKTVEKGRGLFDEYRGKLIVAVDNPFHIWIQILVHEFAHVQQYLNNVPVYTKVRVDLDTWLSHHKKHESTLRKIKEMELDCERRGLKIIDEFNLPIKKADFCKRASSYIHYYNYMLLNPKWCKVPPYEIPEIYDSMPSTLRGKYESLGKFESVYRQYYD
jgi:hypothetical protein